MPGLECLELRVPGAWVPGAWVPQYPKELRILDSK